MKENKKILFICGHYAFPSAANSICIQNLAEEFVRMGYYPWVLAKGCEYIGKYEEINGVKVWKYRGDIYGKVVSYFSKKSGLFYRICFGILQLLRYSVILWFYPESSPQDTPKVYRRAKKIIEEQDIGLVVASYMPYEAINVAIKLKKTYGDKLRVITYHLDLLTNPNNSSALVLFLKKCKVEKALEKEFGVIDKILLPTTAPLYQRGNIEYVDFPLYIPERGEVDLHNEWVDCFNKECINISITGSLDNNNRNPIAFCNLISQLPLYQGRRIVLHIWGKLSGIDLKGIKYVYYHGLAKVEDVPMILRKSDFLLNVGNAISYRMLPSKIFQFFASSRPIFFIYSKDEDKSVPYFKKYKHVCFIKSDALQEDCVISKIMDFIDSYYKKEIIVEQSVFERSKPSYICNRIID